MRSDAAEVGLSARTRETRGTARTLAGSVRSSMLTIADPNKSSVLANFGARQRGRSGDRPHGRASASARAGRLPGIVARIDIEDVEGAIEVALHDCRRFRPPRVVS